jgi:osmotically-inducible protein OsmY
MDDREKAMGEAERICEAVRAALRSEPRVGHAPLQVSWAAGDLTMEGEVADIAAKKLALEAAAGVAGIEVIIDRLRVTPATPMADDEIRNGICNALMQDNALASCTIQGLSKGAVETLQAPAAPAGTIQVSVTDGVVMLDGDVPGLGQKRLAGVLAWWAPGARDVINGLGVAPPEADNDDEITDAVRIALEKDPFVNADQIRVSTRDAAVTLEGLVPSAAEREMAEHDAWSVFGVDRVVNRVAVRA